MRVPGLALRCVPEMRRGGWQQSRWERVIAGVSLRNTTRQLWLPFPSDSCHVSRCRAWLCVVRVLVDVLLLSCMDHPTPWCSLFETRCYICFIDIVSCCTCVVTSATVTLHFACSVGCRRQMSAFCLGVTLAHRIVVLLT